MTCRLALPLLLLVAPGCASKTATSDAILSPHGAYQFSGTLEGRRYTGVVELNDQVVVNSDQGTCREQELQPRQRAQMAHERKLVVQTCMGVSLELAWNEAGQMLPQARLVMRVLDQREQRWRNAYGVATVKPAS